MTPQELAARIQEKSPDKASAGEGPPGIATIAVKPEHLLEFCRELRDADELAFDNLTLLAGVDRGDRLQVIYNLFSYRHRHHLILKVDVPAENGKVPSVTAVWPSANWYEREAHELFGMDFVDHPNLKHLLLDEDWDEGYPMRKGWTGRNFLVMPDARESAKD